MSDDAVTASTRGASLLIIQQIGSRAITFALNQILLRFLSPELLGASVQLELYKIGALYFSRESLRVATERRSDGGVQAAVNLAYLAIAAGVPIGFAFAQWYLGVGYPDVPLFAEALRVNELAAVIELLSEPAYVAVQQKMLYRIRAAAEVPGIVIKTVTTAGLVFWSRYRDVELGVLPFAAGELANSATMAIVYNVRVASVSREQLFSLFPKKMRSSPQHQYAFSYFSRPLLWLTSSLYFQTCVKWLLTEGDKLLVAAFATLEDQGMYAVSANYGGLIARMLFKPIEESSRNLFANLCATPPPANGTTLGDGGEKEGQSESKKNIQSAASILHDILRGYSMLSLVAFAIGPAAAPLLLRIVAGSRWSDSGAGEVLGTYCYYIPFLAINGVTEAFVAATATTSDLHRQSFWMTCFSILFAGSAYLFLRVLKMGAKGLVLANCVNMALRIVFNMSFVTRFFRKQGQNFEVLSILPHLYAIGVAAVVPAVLSQSKGLAFLHPYGMVGDLARIGAVGAAFAGVIVATERKFLSDLYRRVRG